MSRRFILDICKDIVLFSFSVLSAYVLSFQFQIPTQFIVQIPFVMLLNAFITISFIAYYNLYRRDWLFASVGELYSISKAVTYSFIVMMMLNEVIIRLLIPPSTYILIWLINILLIGTSRYIIRLKGDSYVSNKKRGRKNNNAIIIGAGEAGALVIKQLKNSRDTDIYPAALIDDNPQKKGLRVLGVPVVGNRHDILESVKKMNISTIIFALPSAKKQEFNKIYEICKQTDCALKILPNVQEIIDGKVSIESIRNIDIEDLLGREPVMIDLENVASFVKGKILLVTGAGGSIGSELCRQVLKYKPKEMILFDNYENEIFYLKLELEKKFPSQKITVVICTIREFSKVQKIFMEYRPDVIFHAAAHKHVPLMESHPDEAIKNNVFGTRNVVKAAIECGASSFVMISTDKAVNPTNIMGASKRLAEMVVQSFDRNSKTKFVSVRFGNVLGSHGSVIPIFKNQIAQGGPVTVTHPDMIRYFMTIPEAVQLVLQAGSIAKDNEIFVLDMGEPVKISTLAKNLIKLSGYEPGVDIDIVYTGMRPGEKLYEELFTKAEQFNATCHNRIFISKQEPVNPEEIKKSLTRLEEALESGEDLRPIIKKLVPSLPLTSELKGAPDEKSMSRQSNFDKNMLLRT